MTPHGPHTGTDPAYPPRVYRVSVGKPSGSSTLDTTQPRSVPCASSACHDLTEAAASSLETRTEETAPAFAFTGTWWNLSSSYASGGAMRYASKPGAVTVFSFSGSGTLRLYGRKDPYSGKARISVDGGPSQLVDLHSLSTEWRRLLFDTGPLSDGDHTLRVEPDGTRNAAAMGTKVQVDYALTLTTSAANFKPACDGCHATEVEPHGYNPATHISTAGTCAESCHTAEDLDTVHGRAGLTCTSCHSSENAAVRSAIRDGDTACSTCHATIHAYDKAFCYNCHEPALRNYPGRVLADGAKHMSVTSSTRAAVTYPGTGYGATACANCHSRHGSGQRAEGNDLCYGCHDAPGVNLAGYGYPGRALYEAARHARNRRLDWKAGTQAELGTGALSDSVVNASGKVELIAEKKISTGSPYTLSRQPSPDYPDSTGRYFTDGQSNGFGWKYSDLGIADGGVGTVDITVDLGSAQLVNRVYLDVYFGDILEVLSSTDGSSFTSRMTSGSLGLRQWGFDLRPSTPFTARWVRFRVTKDLDPLYSSNNDSIYVYEGEIYTPISSGTWTSPAIDISDGQARDALSSAVTWSGETPAGTSIGVEGSLSVDGGASWSAWQGVDAGGAIPGLSAATDMDLARLRLRATLTRPDNSTPVRLDEIAAAVGYSTTGALETWPGVTATRGACINCHDVHDSTNPGARRVLARGLCDGCHVAEKRPERYSYQGPETYAASKHLGPCSKCHVTHSPANPAEEKLLAAREEQVCFGCHNDPAKSKSGVSIQAKFTALADRLAHHDVTDADQAAGLGKVECHDCHQPHAANRTATIVQPDDPYKAAYTPTAKPDWRVTPSVIVTIPVTKDTWIRPNDANNHGTHTNLYVGPYDQAGVDDRSLLYFPTTAIPAGAKVVNAYLMLEERLYGHATANSIEVRKVLSSWNEGTAGYKVNNATYNGATGYERWYGNNAWSGNFAGGDWNTSGGDFSSTVYSRNELSLYPAIPFGTESAYLSTWMNLEITDLVEELRSGSNYGVALTAAPASGGYLSVYARDAEPIYGVGHAPYVWIEYIPTEPTTTVTDGVTFCLQCHDGQPPRGVIAGNGYPVSDKIRPLMNVDKNWRITNAHGRAPSKTKDYALMGGGAKEPCGLKAPYRYGMGELQCVDCHDPHGSSNVYHLKETVNGVSGLRVTGYNDGAGTKQWCAACHTLPAHGVSYNSCFLNPSCHVHESLSRF